MKYILLIVSCKKYSNRRHMQLHTWIPQLPKNVSYFYIIGDKERCGNSEFLFDGNENMLYVNTNDDYLSLPSKIITAIHAVQQTMMYDYILKTDDDQILIKPSFFEILDKDISSHHYGGYTIDVDNHASTYWMLHDELPKELLLEKTKYCSGRFYFLSPFAVCTLLEKRESISSRIIEDHAIGFYLPDDVKQSMWKMNDIVHSSLIDDITYISSKNIIFTECVTCPEMCLNAIISYQKYHSHPIRVFLMPDDLSYFEKHKNMYDLSKVIFQCVNGAMDITYQQDGHLGTAMIWENIIRSYPIHNIIHFDSDVIFRGDIINDIIHELFMNDLVGPVRSYTKNIVRTDEDRYQPDVVSTYCFGFKTSMIRVKEYGPSELLSMIRGFDSQLPFLNLKFFDPISYLILHNGGKMKELDCNTIGGFTKDGSRLNSYPIVNAKMDCGDKIIHFSSVGIGICLKKAFKKGITTRIPHCDMEDSFRALAAYQYLLFGVESEEVDESIKGLRAYFNELVSIPFVPITL
jgi:hypothetical protein